MSRVLVVDDRQPSRELLARELREAGLDVAETPDGSTAWRAFCSQRFDLVVADLRMPGVGGIELLRRIRSSRESPDPSVPVLLVSAYGDLSTATDAGKSGATDFFPMNEQGIAQLVERVKQLTGAERSGLPFSLIGQSREITRARDHVRALASLATPVLLVGEAGTGRSAVAAYIHRTGALAAQPFVDVECGTEPAEGADREAGTLYLRGVDQLVPASQKTWRERLLELEDAGTAAPLRIVASTSADLRQLASSGVFDAALADRLVRYAIKLPSLRDRLQDLEALAPAVLETICYRIARPGIRIHPAAMRRLRTYEWYGNLSEFQGAIERLAALALDGEIREEQVDDVLRELAHPLKVEDEQRLRADRETLFALYRKHRGNLSAMGRELGLTANGVKYRLRSCGLQP